jgi:Peptidase MA superfamily
VKPKTGDSINSPRYAFDYEDNRFAWQRLEKGLFHIHWVAGDLVFGQEAENVAEKGLSSIQNLIPLATPVDPFEIYLYPHAKDLQDSLEIGGEPWVAGHASPDLGVVLVSIPIGPEQELNMEQQIPHELAHVMLYQKTGEKYASIPVWLSEGFASLAEVYPNADYSRALDVARQNQSLLPMDSLCQAFPRDASGAFLAYAQSASFTRFIQQNYGSSGLNRLIQSYMDGLGCSEGIMTALGVTLRSLDTQWEQEVLGINVQAVAWQKLSPYLGLFGLLLVFTLIPGFLIALRGKEKTA